jgi:hypothetical protein
MFKLSKKCAMRQAQVPDFAGAYSSLGGTMLSFNRDTLSEYQSGLGFAQVRPINPTNRRLKSCPAGGALRSICHLVQENSAKHPWR